MTKIRPIVTRSAQDLAALLDLDEAESRWIELRADLLARITREVRQRGLTHEQAALLAQTSRSRMTGILNGNLTGISTDLLLRIIASLGLRAKIRFVRAA